MYFPDDSPFSNCIAFDSYIPGYFFMGLGGPFLFISSMQLSNAFPRNSGQVLSILTGSFDASSCIFLLYRLAYSNGLKVSIPTFFLTYLTLPILCIIVQIWYMPRDSYKSEFEIAAEEAERRAHVQETTPLLQDHTHTYLHPNDQYGRDHAHVHARITATGGIESEIMEEMYGGGRRASVFTIPKERRVSYDVAAHHPKFSNPVSGAMQGKKSLEQIKSPWWILMSMFAMIMMVRVNYYIATVWPQARYLLGDEAGTKVNHVFDVILPRMLPSYYHANGKLVESFPCPLLERFLTIIRLPSS